MVFFSDEQIRKEVVAKLSTDRRIDSSGIQVEVHGGVVKLAGTVPSAMEMTRAYADAAVVSGGSNIVDGLTINAPDHQDLSDDGALKIAVSRMLAAEPEIDPSRVMVMVQDRRVILEGSVDAGWKKDYVEARVASRLGIESVDSKLTVVPTKDAADQATADDLMRALDRHPLVGAHDLVVQVEDGAVTLSGVVASETARDTAELLATHIFGATFKGGEIAIADGEG